MKATVTLFAYGDVKAETVDCFVKEMRQAPWLGYEIKHKDALISMQRSKSLSHFLKATDFDVLLMVDRDMVWEPGGLVRLAEKCQETRAIVSGLYPRRDFGEGPTGRFLTPGVYTSGQDTLSEAAMTGAGFLAIHRVAAETIAARLPSTKDGWPFFIPLVDDPAMGDEDAIWGEDFSFCIRARRAGVPVYLWLGAEIDHLGSYRYRMIDSIAIAPTREPVTFKAYPQEIRDLPMDLSVFMHQPLESINKWLKQGTRVLTQLWDKPADELGWYKREGVGKAYLFDLANWHMGDWGQVICDQTKGITGKRVLDFGAGIGTWSLILAGQGNAVEYIEPNEVLAGFTDFRARKYKVPLIRVYEPHGEYDLIVCVDVLEHVGDLAETVQTIAGALASDGLLICHAPFEKAANYPMHHTLPRGVTVNDLWQAAGLEQVEPCKYRKRKEEEIVLCLSEATTAKRV